MVLERLGRTKRRATVKDIYEILRQKEIDCARVQAEIEALRLVIPLLDGEKQSAVQPGAAEQEDNLVSEAKANGTEGPAFSSLGGTEPGFWKRRR
jgi:hypothetical protein